MISKALLFDLDGTLTDSGEGIINCVTYALNTLNLPVPSREELRVFVGPPLRDSFQKFGVSPEDTEKAVEIYRSRYVPVGMFENTPYPGISALLAALKSDGHTLYVATSKPESMAQEIMEKFHLAGFFDKICGATLDGSRDSKELVIAYLLEHIPCKNNVLMIGDTVYDVLGAASHGIDTIGVSWGYGKEEDLLQAGALAIAHSPSELYELLS